MIRRRAVIGLSLLCALMFSALVAQSASAQKGTAAANTTAFTCVENGGAKDFSDAHCDTFVGAEKGKFGHVAIKAGEATEIEVTNEATTVDTKGRVPAILTATIAKVAIEMSCEVVSSSGENWIENKEVGKEHKAKGTVKVELTKCKVLKPGKCEVKEPIVTTAKFVGVEGLKSATQEKTMGVEFTEDEGGFAELFFKGAECALGEKTFPITGSTIATGKPEPTQATKHSGATSIYVPNKTPSKPAEEMETLKLGEVGVHLSGTFTTRMAGKGNPITLTTVT